MKHEICRSPPGPGDYRCESRPLGVKHLIHRHKIVMQPYFAAAVRQMQQQHCIKSVSTGRNAGFSGQNRRLLSGIALAQRV